MYVAAAFEEVPRASAQVLRSSSFAVRAATGSYAKLAAHPCFSSETIRVVPGGQASMLPLPDLLDATFEVAAQSDRVGIRLLGAPMPHSLELTSEPAGFGAVQITRDGSPIILGPEGPTIGGYPKIAHVISADLDRLGQLRPGDDVRFAVVTIEEARRLRHVRERALERELSELSIALQLG